jgi:hypothetical protein
MQHEMHTAQTEQGDKEAKRERRRAIRHQCRVHIEMLIRCASGLSGDQTTNTLDVKGRLLDLSTEGAMLHTKQDFAIGQELRLTIFLPGHPAVVATASVRWCKPLPEKEKEFASGALFLALSKDGLNVIQGFLEELAQQAGN